MDPTLGMERATFAIADLRPKLECPHRFEPAAKIVARAKQMGHRCVTLSPFALLATVMSMHRLERRSRGKVEKIHFPTFELIIGAYDDQLSRGLRVKKQRRRIFTQLADDATHILPDGRFDPGRLRHIRL